MLSPSAKRPLAALLLCTLLIRAGWALYQGPGVDAGLPDQQEYLQLATNVLEGRGLVLHDPRFQQDVYAYRTPGYPLFLAALGAQPILIRVAQAILDTSTVLAVYLLARRWLPEGHSLLAGAFVALSPFLVYFSGLLLSETLFTALLAWSMFLLTGRRTFFWGLPLALLAVLVRPSASLLAVLLVLPGAMISGLRVWRTALLTTALLLVALFPWALRNRLVLGQWVWLTSNSGITRYDGFNPGADGSSDQTFLCQPGLSSVLKMNELQRDRYFAEASSAYIRQTWRLEPTHLVKLTVAKIARTWSPMPLSDQFGRRRLYVVAAMLYSIPFDILVVMGLLIWRAGARHASPSATIGQPTQGGACPAPTTVKVFLAMPAVYFTIIHALSVGSLRYRLPAEPPLAVMAAMGLMALIDYLRRPQWRRGGRP